MAYAGQEKMPMSTGKQATTPAAPASNPNMGILGALGGIFPGMMGGGGLGGLMSGLGGLGIGGMFQNPLNPAGLGGLISPWLQGPLGVGKGGSVGGFDLQSLLSHLPFFGGQDQQGLPPKLQDRLEPGAGPVQLPPKTQDRFMSPNG